MSSIRNQFIELVEQDKIPSKNMVEALSLTQISPSNHAWYLFLNHLLLWIGGLSLAFSGLFFIAYNWTEIGHFTKFAMLETAIALSIVSYWKAGSETVGGKLSLLMASLFLGVLLALYGQTYQTGADPWQLFFNWALLMLPWAIIGRFSAIWIVWLLLINLSIVLYYQTFRSLLGVMFSSEIQLLWTLFALNTIALVGWQVLALKWKWLQQNWAIRILATTSGFLISWLVIYNIFDERATAILSLFCWAIWMSAIYWFYRTVKPDLFMLAGFCLSGIVVTTAIQIHFLISDIHAGNLLFIALMIIGLATAAAVWLKKVNKELKQ